MRVNNNYGVLLCALPISSRRAAGVHVRIEMRQSDEANNFDKTIASVMSTSSPKSFMSKTVPLVCTVCAWG